MFKGFLWKVDSIWYPELYKKPTNSGESLPNSRQSSFCCIFEHQEPTVPMRNPFSTSFVSTQCLYILKRKIAMYVSQYLHQLSILLIPPDASLLPILTRTMSVVHFFCFFHHLHDSASLPPGSWSPILCKRSQ